MSNIDNAVMIAAEVHKGQKDKAGTPYILHPLRLMLRMTTEEERIAAVLHDVVEDSAEYNRWTLERLRRQGFSEPVVEAIDSLTRRDEEEYDEFIERSASNPIARTVKIADLEDNMNMLRIGELLPKDLDRLRKYHRSWRRLTAGGQAKS